MAGEYAVSVFIGDKEIVGSPFNTVLEPGLTAPSASVAYGASLTGARAGENAQFYIQLRDKYGNMRYSGGEKVSVKMIGASVPKVILSDRHNGTYFVRYIATISGSYLMSVMVGSVGIQGSPYQVRIQPGAADPANHELVDSHIPSSEAGHECAFVLRARDRYSNAVPQGGSVVHVEASGPALVAGTITDSGNGSYVAQLVATVSGNYAVSILVDSEPIKNAPFSMQVTPSVAAPETTLCAGYGLKSCVAGVMANFTVIAHDQHKNRRMVGGEIVSVKISGKSPDGQLWQKLGQVVDTGAGVYGVLYNCTTAGKIQIHITMGELPILGSPFEADCAPAVADPMSSVLDQANLGSCAAGAPCVHSLRLLDRFENMWTSPGPEVVTAKVAGIAPARSRALNLRDGSYHVIVEATISGQYTLSVDLNGKAIRHSPFNLTIHPSGTASAMHSGVLLVPNSNFDSLVAAQTGSLLVVARDAFGNQRVSGGDSFEAIMESGPSGSVIATQVTYVQNGTYNVSFSATRAGVYSLTVRQNSQDIVNSPLPVTVVPDVTDGSNSKLHYSTIYSAAGDPGSFQITTFDAFLNARTSGGDNITVHLKPVDWQLQETNAVSVQVVDKNTGWYDIRFVAVQAGQYSVETYVNGHRIETLQWFVRPTKPSPRHFVALPLEPTLAGDTGTLEVTLRDAYGNERPKLSESEVPIATFSDPRIKLENLPSRWTDTTQFSFRSTVSGTFFLDVRYGDEAVLGSPFRVQVAPSNPEFSSCTPCASMKTEVAAGEESEVCMQAVDSYGNKRDVGGGTWLVGMAQGHARLDSATLHDHNDGTYSARMLATRTGSYRFTIIRDSHILKKFEDFFVHVHPGPVSASESVVWGEDGESMTAGETRIFYAQLVDDFGNNITTMDALNVTASLGRKDSESAAIVRPAVHQVEMQRYSFEVAPIVATTYEILVTLGSSALKAMPRRFIVIPAPPSAPHSSLEGIGTKNATVGQPQSVAVVVRDRFSNLAPANLSDLSLELRIRGESRALSLASAGPQDLGRYTAEYTVFRSELFHLEGRINEVDVANSPLPLFHTPGPCVPSKTILALVIEHPSQRTPVGTLRSALFHTVDAFDNRLVAGGEVPSVSTTDASRILHESMTDFKNGSYLVQFTTTTAGSVSVDFYLNAYRVDSKEVSFVPEVGNSTLSTASIPELKGARLPMH